MERTSAFAPVGHLFLIAASVLMGACWSPEQSVRTASRCPGEAYWFGRPLASADDETAAKAFVVPAGQCQVFVYASTRLTPYWRIGDVVVVPQSAQPAGETPGRAVAIDADTFAVWTLLTGVYRLHGSCQPGTSGAPCRSEQDVPLVCRDGELLFFAEVGGRSVRLEPVTQDEGMNQVRKRAMVIGIRQADFGEGMNCR